jgi:UPF0271 protein
MGLRVIDPGQFATVQDLGRRGFAHLGVPRGGAGDPLSLRVGNRLVGNADDGAGVEMTLVGGEFEATEAVAVAIAGADCGVVVRSPGMEERRVPPWSVVQLRAGDRIRVGAMVGGARAYLCVAGGLDLPVVLGGRGALFGAGVPGVQGRALRAGDLLAAGAARTGTAGVVSEAAVARLRAWLHAPVLRVVPEPADDGGRLLTGEFCVSHEWDRRGLRLMGEVAPAPGGGLSRGVDFGCLERTPDGKVILLGPDSPVTGGYPVEGCVGAVDLPAVGQLRGGRRVRFEMVSVERAWELLREREAELDAIIAPNASENAGKIEVIEFSADVGEEPGALERDAAIARFVSALNIACGGHAGDESTMREMVRAGLAHGCAIGAHPSYPDRANFGRTDMQMSPEALEASLRRQLASLRHVAEAMRAGIAHVKPHGALYHAAMCRREVNECVARAAEAECPGAALVGSASGEGLLWWQERRLAVLPEVLVDRRYLPDGRVVARGDPDALLSPVEAAEQALAVVRGKGVMARGGARVRLAARVLGMHSDTPRALEVARAVRAALEGAGVRVGRREWS